MKNIRTMSSKQLFLISITAGLLMMSIHFTTPKAAGAAPCTRDGGNTATRTLGGYDYRLIHLDLNGFNSRNTAPLYLSTLQCDGDYGGSMDPRGLTTNASYSPSRRDLVYFNQGVFRQLVKTGGTRTVAPTRMELGVNEPAFGGTVPGSYNCVLTPPTLTPPIAHCNSNPSENVTRGSFIDDSGRLIVGGQNGDRMMWCVGMSTPPVGYGNGTQTCTPSVLPNQRGAGFLFRSDQCLQIGAINGNCGQNGYTSWYRSPGTNGQVDISDQMNKDGEGYFTGGYYNHIDAYNTWTGGFAANNYFTMRYTKNQGTCTYTSFPNGANQNITVTMRNQGTRVWRNSDGYLVRITNNLGTPSFRSVGTTYRNGDTWVFNVTLPIGGFGIKLGQDINGSGATSSNAAYRANDANYDNFISSCTATGAGSFSCTLITPTSIGVRETSPMTIRITNNGATVAVPNNANVTVSSFPSGNVFFGPTAVYFSGFGSPPSTFSFTGGTARNLTSFNVTPAAVNLGDFTVRVMLGSTVVANCLGTTANGTVFAKPYVRTYGGDIIAGNNDGVLATNCTNWGADSAVGSAGVYGFRLGASSTQGSAAQLGIFALGSVDNAVGYGFSSAVLRSISPAVPRGLTFANVGTLGNSGISHCPYDYFNNRPANTANIGPIFLVDLNALPVNSDNSYYTSAGALISGPIYSTRSGNPKTTRATLFVDGDLIIATDVTYNSSNAWQNKSEVPRVQVVARGNIYIQQGVRQLDGVYIAQPLANGTKGIIYTCSNIGVPYSGSPAQANNIYDQCKEQLTINGSLVAKNIEWLRSFGAVADSTTSELPNGGNGNIICNNQGAGQSTPRVCASEVVNLGAESWLVGPSLPMQQVRTPFDYVTALPPLL